MDRKPFGHWSSLVVAALIAIVVSITACTEGSAPQDEEGGAIAPQASGKFSSGSVFAGSVNGQFTIVGIGNIEKEPHVVEFVVDGDLWFTCVNGGGNEAPGQFDFVLGDSGIPAPADGADHNGKYETDVLTVDPKDLSDEDCKRNKNWVLKRYEDPNPYGETPGDPVTYVDPNTIYAYLYELDPDEGKILADMLQWECDTPDPTYPLEEYELPEPGLEGFCDLVVGSI